MAVPEGWQGEVISVDPPTFYLERRHPAAFGIVSWISGYQPSLSRDNASMLLDRVPSLPGVETGPEDIEISLLEELGPTLIARTVGETATLDIRLLSALFGVDAGVGFIRVATRTQEQSDEALAEIIGGLNIAKPGLSSHDLHFGHHAAEAGYTLDLPASFRALTDPESRRLGLTATIESSEAGTAKSQEVFLDPTDLTGQRSFGCGATQGAIEVVDPAKSAAYHHRYQQRVSTALRDRAYAIDDILQSPWVAAPTPVRAVHISPNDPGTLALVDLEDRNGYLWRIPALRGNADGMVLALYTSWDNISLDCLFYTDDAADPLLEEIDTAMRSLRVTDGEYHPMRLSVHAQYVALWPFTHPLLQIWWMAAALCGASVVGGLWTLRA